MMIRQHLGLEKGLGWARTAQFWTLERVCDAGCVPGDVSVTLVALALRAVRALTTRATETEAGLPAFWTVLAVISASPADSTLAAGLR